MKAKIWEPELFSLPSPFPSLLHPRHWTLYGDPVQEVLTMFVPEEWEESLEAIYSNPCHWLEINGHRSI